MYKFIDENSREIGGWIVIIENKIVSINSHRQWYCIDLETGEKYTIEVVGKQAGICPDLVDENDVIRAKRDDGTDIRSLLNKSFEITDEKINKIKEFILSNAFPVLIEKIL